MGDVKIIKENDSRDFRFLVNKCLEEGYKIISSDCKITDDSSNKGIFQAMLYKED